MIPLARCQTMWPDGLVNHGACDGWNAPDVECHCACHGDMRVRGAKHGPKLHGCGTPAGWVRCKARPEGACPECVTARQAYRNHLPRPPGVAKARQPADLALYAPLVAAVALGMNSTVEAILGPSRARSTSAARHVGMYLARRCGLSYPETARLFGCDHHTTAMSAVAKVSASVSRRADAEACWSLAKFPLTSTS